MMGAMEWSSCSKLINKSGTRRGKSRGSTGFHLGIVGREAEMVSECVIVSVLRARQRRQTGPIFFRDYG